MEEKLHKDLMGLSSNTQPLEAFKKAIADGLGAPEFSKTVAGLCKQLRIFAPLDQDVNEMSSPQDANSFSMDVSSFLQELECPYTQLVAVPLGERLGTPANRLLLLDFLIGELQAARLNYVNNGPQVKESRLSPLGENLKKICYALDLSLPPADVDTTQLFARLESKLQETLSQLPPGSLAKPLLTTQLTPEQWDQVEKFNDAMAAEYRLRREMLLKRFDVTVQSFAWSEKAKAQEAQLNAVYMPRRKEMSVDSKVSIADVMAAREDLLYVEKTSSHSVRKYTECDVNKTLMGGVPDRGGRPNEAVAPPRDMPGFKPRVEFGGRGRGRGGGGYRGGSRGGGGRVQSGWGSGGHRGGGGVHGDGDSRSFHRGGGRGRGRGGNSRGTGDNFGYYSFVGS